MLVVETIAKIRRAYFVQWKSIKAIVRELRVSRKTVRKVIRSEETALSYERSSQTHLAVGIVRACIRAGARGRFFNVVDLVNKLDAEARTGKQGRTADLLGRLDFLVLDELGYLPSPRPAASCSST